MENTVISIRESFNRGIRTFEHYIHDIQKSLAQFDQQVKEMETYINDSGS